MRYGSISNWALNVLLSFLLIAGASASEKEDEAPADAVRSVGIRQVVIDEVKISGIRIEPLESHEESSFLGYTSKGVTIIRPNQEVRLLAFGMLLDQVDKIYFVPSSTNLVNCTANDAIVVGTDDFALHSNERIAFKIKFPRVEDGAIFHMCILPKSHGKKAVFTEVSDSRSCVSTETPPRKYYFPMWFQVCLISFLLILSGLFSGLNLGLMALTVQELMLIQKSGSKTERKYADAILPVRSRGNLLLCSLLIGNVLVNSGISILLDDLTSGYVALIASSAGIVVFGEIFPQSLCVKKGLAVGAKTIWVTRFFMIITFPIAFPISKVLDYLLGDEVQSFDRKRLMELIKMSSSEGLQEELKIAVGAMEISDKSVRDVMTRIDDVFMLPDTTVLNTKTVAEILRMGYTRIPVYTDGDRNSVVSLLFVKDLALLDPDDGFTIQTVCHFHQHPLRFVMEDTPLRVMLEEFKKGDYHLAMVQRIVQSSDKDPTYELVGVCTLEDIVEEILQAEIVDETDAIMDNVNRTRRRGAQARDVVCLIDNDEPSRVISVQMQLVTMQWLTTNHRAFHQDMITQTVLEKLIRQHCRRVELTHLPNIYDQAGIPRTAKLYTKQEYSDKFILILEGRALVTIGQDQMTFEAGPWQAFGTEMLERLVARCESGKEKDDFNSRTSLVASGVSGDRDRDHAKPNKLGFVPDFSVVVRDDCTFLEITANNWLLAYKTTLISRGGNRWLFADVLSSSAAANGALHRSFTDGAALYRRGSSAEEDSAYPLLTPSLADVDQPLQRTPSRCSLDDGKMLIVNPQVANIRRGGKGRSCSESEHVELLPRNGGSPLSDRSVVSQI